MHDLNRMISLHESSRPPMVQLTRGDTLQITPVRWAWKPFLACGKMSILAGAPGCGKTTLAIRIAAHVTTGKSFPNGEPCERGDVVVWSGEDDASDTLLPRFLASGGDAKRIHFVGGVVTHGDARPFDPATDIPALLEALQIIRPRLLICDPIVSAVAGDSHKSVEVRRGLQPLVDLCAALDCALLGITHFSKGTGGRDPTERVTGSIAFAALARIVLVAAKGEQNEGEPESARVLMISKSNIGTDMGGVAYALESKRVPGHAEMLASVAEWRHLIEGNARDVLARAEENGKNENDSSADCAEVLQTLLSQNGGRIKAESAIAELKALGFNKPNWTRAKNALGIKSRKDGMRDGWFWSVTKGTQLSEGYEESTQKEPDSSYPSHDSSQEPTEIAL